MKWFLMQNLRATLDNTLSTVDDILNAPDDALDEATGAFRGSSVGFGLTNVIDQDVVNLRANVETLKSQLTLSNIDKLSGAVSDADLALLVKSVKSLDLRQGTDQVKKHLKTIQRITIDARKNVAKKYGIPDTIPDTPDVETSPEDLNAQFEALSKEFQENMGR